MNASDMASSLLLRPASFPFVARGLARSPPPRFRGDMMNGTANDALRAPLSRSRRQRGTVLLRARGDRMDFRILGSTEVLDGTRRVELPAGRGRALLALLILHAGEPVAAERIVDELWGEDPPRTAGTVVQGLVSRLRRALEPGRAKGDPPALLQTVGSGYRLAIDPESVDADRFKRLFDQAGNATPEERSAMLSAALRMWRGPALADFTYEPFAQRAIAALEELRIEAIEDRFDADLALGRGGELVAELEETIAAHPFRERLRGFLMLALYRAGRQAEALDSYRRTRSLLMEEL